jgi:cell division protein FtsQ
VTALESLLALNTADDLLTRDITVIDLRVAARPVLRLAPHALNEARRARGLAVTTEKAESDL